MGLKDIDELYRAWSDRLMRIVRAGVRAPEPLVEDACQFAWSRLMHRREEVRRETVVGWLIATAVHEALKLLRNTARETSLETMLDAGLDLAAHRGERTPYAVTEQRERLRSLALLPQRQQRLLWLYGLGLSYEEIGRSQGCTSRTVERQLRRARAALQTPRMVEGAGRARGRKDARTWGAL